MVLEIKPGLPTCKACAQPIMFPLLSKTLTLFFFGEVAKENFQVMLLAIPGLAIWITGQPSARVLGSSDVVVVGQIHLDSVQGTLESYLGCLGEICGSKDLTQAFSYARQEFQFSVFCHSYFSLQGMLVMMLRAPHLFPTL